MNPELNDTAPGAIEINVTGRVVLMLSIILPSFAMSGIAPILPAIRTHFSSDPNAAVLARLLVTIVGVTVAVAAPLVGALADRLGCRRVFLAGLIVYGTMGSAAYFLDNLYQILATRAVLGVGSAALGATIFAIIAKGSSGRARSRWLGYTITVASFSMTLVIPLVSALGDHGWQRPFLVHAFAFPMFLLGLIGLEPDKPIAVAEKQHSARQALPWAYIAAALASGVLCMTPMLYIPFRLSDVGVTSPGQIGLATIPLTALSALTALFYGYLRRWLSTAMVFALSFGLLAAGLILNALADNLIMLMITHVIIGMGSGLTVVNIYARGGETGSDSQRAQMMGIAKAGLCIGPMLGQLILEPIVARSSAAGGVMVLGILALALAIIQYALSLRAGFRWSLGRSGAQGN